MCSLICTYTSLQMVWLWRLLGSMFLLCSRLSRSAHLGSPLDPPALGKGGCLCCWQGARVNRAWTLEADEVVVLPLDELALMVLRDAYDNKEWNWGNWLLAARQVAKR